MLTYTGNTLSLSLLYFTILTFSEIQNPNCRTSSPLRSSAIPNFIGGKLSFTKIVSQPRNPIGLSTYNFFITSEVASLRKFEIQFFIILTLCSLVYTFAVFDLTSCCFEMIWFFGSLNCDVYEK